VNRLAAYFAMFLCPKTLTCTPATRIRTARELPFEGHDIQTSAIVQTDPPPASEISSSTPPEVERLIARCLRKDMNRRSQNMADVKLALEELRDESASGKLVRPVAAPDAGRPAWVWPAVAVACVLVAAALIWIYANLRGSQSKGPDLLRVSPDDGHSYKVGHNVGESPAFFFFLQAMKPPIHRWLSHGSKHGTLEITATGVRGNERTAALSITAGNKCAGEGIPKIRPSRIIGYLVHGRNSRHGRSTERFLHIDDEVLLMRKKFGYSDSVRNGGSAIEHISGRYPFRLGEAE